MANRLEQNNRKRKAESSILLGVMELKNKITDDDQFKEAVHQVVCYMVSALVYSQWGVLQTRAPLVALLVASNCVYRVTLSRTKEKATGFMKTIDKAKDVASMEWILSDYIERCISDMKVTSRTPHSKSQVVNPFDWAPLNFGSSEWISTPDYNFGFLFNTSSDEVIRVKEHYHLEWDFGTLLPGANVIVKHVNSILDVDFELGLESIMLILLAEARDVEKARADTEKARADAAEAELALLKGKNPPPSALGHEPDGSPKHAPSNVKNVFGIKHPYLAIIRCSAGPLFVMKDVGAPLSTVMQSTEFRQRWAQSASLRGAFFSEIGLSALNLVNKVGRCHNDIRPPNIAFDGESFCLIDFDFSRTKISSNKESAFNPSLLCQLNSHEEMMCFSVAQIALTVFMLSGSKVFDLGAVTNAVSIWKRERGTSDVDVEFEGWVQGKGGLLLDFVSAVRGASSWPSTVGKNSKKYFTDVLSQMLL